MLFRAAVAGHQPNYLATYYQLGAMGVAFNGNHVQGRLTAQGRSLKVAISLRYHSCLQQLKVVVGSARNRIHGSMCGYKTGQRCCSHAGSVIATQYQHQPPTGDWRAVRVTRSVGGHYDTQLLAGSEVNH